MNDISKIKKAWENYQQTDEVSVLAEWDYPQSIKSKGPASKEVVGQRGRSNRKARKAFRKAERAKAHAARMRGEVVEDDSIDEGIFGKPADKKSAIIRYAGIKAEDGIRLAQLGMELYEGEDDRAVKIFTEIRKELIELKVWLRERK